jgi:hypothetical protein
VEAAIKLIRTTSASREALIDLRLTGKLNLNGLPWI